MLRAVTAKQRLRIRYVDLQMDLLCYLLSDSLEECLELRGRSKNPKHYVRLLSRSSLGSVLNRSLRNASLR